MDIFSCVNVELSESSETVTMGLGIASIVFGLLLFFDGIKISVPKNQPIRTFFNEGASFSTRTVSGSIFSSL